ncbi:MAG: hypothetical protein CMP20_15850 [Rickettsiales bacterium]|nr:hypothetical protein [Rickettsiales bacterium]
MSREEHLAQSMKNKLEQKLLRVPEGTIVETELDDLPPDVDPAVIVDCIRIGGCVVWIEEAKPHYGSLRVYRNQRKVCALRQP